MICTRLKAGKRWGRDKNYQRENDKTENTTWPHNGEYSSLSIKNSLVWLLYLNSGDDDNENKWQSVARGHNGVDVGAPPSQPAVMLFAVAVVCAMFIQVCCTIVIVTCNAGLTHSNTKSSDGRHKTRDAFALPRRASLECN